MMKKWSALIAVFTFMAVFVSSGNASERPNGMSSIQFSNLPENYGRPWRVVERRYEEYRNGRLEGSGSY